MHYLTYVVGSNADHILGVWRKWWTNYTIQGKLGALLGEACEEEGNVPTPYNLVLANGRWLSQHNVNEDQIQSYLNDLDREDITVVDIVA